ncbi:condensation domain-containing protein [Archangium lansingense]|uniref:Condensation domain-containing protein n=1 Tax=Archangium lansingense TaxID=2995310 RepID=A0ABT4A2X7_9BACT|nr:condensation domain-containing protein [Archangium lansinium]MCY1075971.1 condensation domain-containing protein [Archangium lansinium]
MTTAFPMSFAQQRLCFLHWLDPSGFAQSSARCFRVTGPLDTTAVRAAVDVLVARHESLRTVFPLGAHQHVLPDGCGHVCVLDVPDETEALRHAEAVVSQPFDLEHGPLLRLTVLRQAPETHFLVFSMHLLVADGCSLQIFFEELAIAYQAAVAGEPAALPELPVQYADWAAWQREQLTEQRRTELARWWRQQLSGLPLVLDLVPPRRAQGRGRRIHRALPSEVAAAVRAFASAERQTVFTVLAAAWGVVLGHCANRQQVLLGLAVANRDLPELERVLGFFVNTVALRVDLSGNPTFRELLARVAEATAAAYAHKDMPFEQLVAELAPPRDPTRSPVVQVNFAYHPVGTAGALELHGCSVTEHLLDFATAKFELTLRVEETASGASILWAEFDESVFDTGFIDGLLSAYEAVLRALEPGEPVSNLLPVRSATERALTRIFADVLGLEAVGPYDDFFRLGGHSLQLIDVAVRVRAELGRHIGLRDLYATPTAAGAAALLEQPGASR